MDGTRHRAATAALGALAAAIAVVGLVTVAGRNEPTAVLGGSVGPPAATPEEAARRLFEASIDGNCAQMRALMTAEFRAQLDRVYSSTELACANLRGARGATLLSVKVPYRAADRAVVVLTTRIPDSADEATALLFVRRAGGWLTNSDNLECADPANADPADCDLFAMQ